MKKEINLQCIPGRYTSIRIVDAIWDKIPLYRILLFLANLRNSERCELNDLLSGFCYLVALIKSK
jgi:hypothetical protein